MDVLDAATADAPTGSTTPPGIALLLIMSFN